MIFSCYEIMKSQKRNTQIPSYEILKVDTHIVDTYIVDTHVVDTHCSAYLQQ